MIPTPLDALETFFSCAVSTARTRLNPALPTDLVPINSPHFGLGTEYLQHQVTDQVVVMRTSQLTQSAGQVTGLATGLNAIYCYVTSGSHGLTAGRDLAW